MANAGTNDRVISNYKTKHQFAFKEGELDKTSTVKEYLIVQKEGNRQVSRKTNYYNLDVIISVGYRVKSQRGVEFRKWANGVLKDYILKGYAVNNNRINELGVIRHIMNVSFDIQRDPSITGFSSCLHINCKIH